MSKSCIPGSYNANYTVTDFSVFLDGSRRKIRVIPLWLGQSTVRVVEANVIPLSTQDHYILSKMIESLFENV